MELENHVISQRKFISLIDRIIKTVFILIQSLELLLLSSMKTFMRKYNLIINQ
jgi:hypothetical protein